MALIHAMRRPCPWNVLLGGVIMTGWVLRTTRAGMMAIGLLAAGSAHAQEPLRVLATVGMVGDLAARVAGPCAQVSSLIGAGADPHLFTPRPSDLRLLRDADLVAHVGHGLEGKLAEVLARVGSLELGPLAVPDAALLRGHGDAVDPHIWMDVGLWSGIVPVVAAAISARRPDCGADIANRAAAVTAELAYLDAWVRDSIATIPPTARVLVTAHDAFAYYGRAYGLEVAALQGFSTEAEASIADMAGTAQLVASRGVPAVFVETTINPRSIEALVEATARAGAKVRIGAPLYSDALGDVGTDAAGYAGMISHNTRTIAAALGGQALALPDLPTLR